MLVSETKKENGYLYEVSIEDGILEYFCEKQIRTKETEKTLDNIFQKIINRPNGEGQITQDGYTIKYKKQIDLWLNE